MHRVSMQEKSRSRWNALIQALQEEVSLKVEALHEDRQAADGGFTKEARKQASQENGSLKVEVLHEDRQSADTGFTRSSSAFCWEQIRPKTPWHAMSMVAEKNVGRGPYFPNMEFQEKSIFEISNQENDSSTMPSRKIIQCRNFPWRKIPFRKILFREIPINRGLSGR